MHRFLSVLTCYKGETQIHSIGISDDSGLLLLNLKTDQFYLVSHKNIILVNTPTIKFEHHFEHEHLSLHLETNKFR